MDDGDFERLAVGPCRALARKRDATIVVGFDGHIIARLSPDGTLRWNREMAIDQAVVAGDGLVVAANVADDAVSVVGVRGDGSVAWRVDGGSVTTRPRLVRTPAATIVAHGGGELAVDDSGVVLWRIDRRGERSSSALAAYVVGAGVVVVHSASAAPETQTTSLPATTASGRPKTGAPT